jgi:Methyltransferase domain
MPDQLTQGLSDRFRSKRDGQLRATLVECPRQSERLRVLDIGGRASYWQRVGFDFLRDLNVEITILNLNAHEMENAPGVPPGLLAYAAGNGCALDYPDGHFDLVHSNSVIEHVGLWRDICAFARETRRVARRFYVQTPNYWFPVDPHYWRLPLFHWLPRPWRAGLVRALPLAHAGRAHNTRDAYSLVDAARLLTRGQMRCLFPEAKIHVERFLMLPKSFTAIGASAPTSVERSL